MDARRTLILIVLLTLAGALGWLVFEHQQSNQDSVAVHEDTEPRMSVSAETESGANPPRESAESSSTTRKRSKNREIGDERDQMEGSNAITNPREFTFVDQIQEVLDRKELSLVYPAYAVLRDCHTIITSNENWENDRRHIERILENGDFPQGEEVHYELLLIEPEQRLADCDALRALGRDSLQSSLISKSNGGDAYARFVYAIWPPYEDDSVNQEVESVLTYERNALEFTLMNLEDGHPLGLLALGLSYGRGGLFTPYRHGLGTALLLAAEACSGGVFRIQHIVEQYMRYLEAPFSNQPTEEEVLAAGVRLYDQYCATSIANAPP